MIAVLVGALSIAVREDFELVGKEGWEERLAPLRTDREAYEELYLQKLVLTWSSPESDGRYSMLVDISVWYLSSAQYSIILAE